METLFGDQHPGLLVNASSDVVYNDQYLRLANILNVSRVKVDKRLYWVETNQDSSRVLTDDQKRIK